ncbi:MAG: hypothetical protein ABJN65_15420 [Parasphingorhabdus sp.]
MEKRDFSAVENDRFDLAKKAGEYGVSSAFLTSDLSNALFPESGLYLSDRLLSNSQQYLRSMIGEIESQLCLKATENLGIVHASIDEIGNGSMVYCYDHLRNAGLLNKSELLEHVFVQAQKVELTNRLLQKFSQEDLENSLASHLDHEDKNIAEAAMALLVSRNRSGFQIGQISCRLSNVPVEIYHDLVWSVTAAVQKISGCSEPKLLSAAELVLAEHDESQSSDNRAQRLAGLLDHAEASAAIPHPIKDGLELFLAHIALRSQLSANQLVIFTAEPNMARLVVVMRALGITENDALSIFTALDGSGNILTPASYKEISREQAIVMTDNWSKPTALQTAERKLSSNQPEIDG